MKPTELRIGNLVKRDGRIFEIHAIDKDYPHLNTEEFGVGVVGWGDIEGVPLTEEILESVGFSKCEYDGDVWYTLFTNDFIRISTLAMGEQHGEVFDDPIIICVSEDEYKHIKFLHQLQNLYFALTGEELNTEGVK